MGDAIYTELKKVADVLYWLGKEREGSVISELALRLENAEVVFPSEAISLVSKIGKNEVPQ